MTTALDDPNPNTSRPPVDAVDAYPLSVAQAGMVHHTELDPRLLPYHCVHSMRVRLPLHVELMRRAVRDVQARHPVLRTSFDFATQDEPVQLVHERAEPAIVVADLRGMPTEPAEWVLRELWHHERKRPFDLARAPLLRLFLHQRTDDVFQWTITEHHAILDAAGRFAVHTEVLDRYRRLLADPEAPPDPAPSRGYGDFVALEREIAADPDEQRYWTTTLAGLEPTTLPRWPTSGATGGHRTLELAVPADLATRLTALAGHAGVPLRTVLLAAHLKVVGIATGRHDIATGVVTSGRPDDSDVRGMFLNVPPLRVDLTGGTWLDLVRRVADAEREMSAHRRYPLASIQWTLGNVELFDTVFEHQPFPASVADFRAEPNHYALTTGYRHDPAESLLLRLDVDTTRVRDAQAEDIRDTYLTVLDAMTEPAAPHEALRPLTAATYQRLMVEWNGPARPYPVDRCVHELIEEQAHRTPDAVAVTDGVVELSYAELNRRANQLARRLLAEGAAPETVIAVLAERTASLVVILLAILKSGAAYLPLEPQYPAERQRYLLADSGATLVVAEHGLAPRLPDGPWAVLDSTRAIREADGLPAGDLGRTSSPDNLMYIIYTSGSTGKPKGVLVPHFGVVNYLGWCTEGYAARGTGGAPVFSSIAFDMIVPNLYTPLITGERLCMLDDSLDPVALADRLDELAPFTFIKLTPGHLDLLDQLLEPGRARRLATTLAVGADAFPTRILDSWRAKDTVSVVLNEYGPTEASVGNTVYVPEGPVAAEQVPIGRAIPNTTMYVLDHAMQPGPARRDRRAVHRRRLRRTGLLRTSRG